MKTNDIRRKFLEYFKGNGHTVLPSSGLIPAADPTLLFTNAGMVQFKKVFTGEEKISYRCAATSQKCVRAGGKHNDLENVGYTKRHHTFFEMLGNFSFGDYFKKEAIIYGWEFLTETLPVTPGILYATVYKDDDEAYGIWKKTIGLPEDRIYRLGNLAEGDEENFWSMGETGPCGPCSEILLDRGEEYGCGKPTCRPGCDCDRYLEIWNLVFMQYERTTQGKMNPLPHPSIDTGMGLERLASVLQDKNTNYDIDIIFPIIEETSKLLGKPYKADKKDVSSFRVIADHIRALTFLIQDGVTPLNEGRGYVLRRILRRAVRHGKRLGGNKPFLYKLVPIVSILMEEPYPGLKKNREHIARIIQIEEEKFHETLNEGLELFNDITGRLKKEGKKIIAGSDAFKLYDTYGFPFDLTCDIARERNYQVDADEFHRLMEEQRKRARLSWKGGAEISEDYMNELKKLQDKHPTGFRGYDTLTTQSRVRAFFRDEKRTGKINRTETAEVIFDVTPCYAESGGQVADKASWKGENSSGEILDVQRVLPSLFVHKLKVSEGTLSENEVVTITVNSETRQNTAVHHTSTHLLQSSLRSVLGSHVRQAGSLVSPDRLRFDFVHYEALTQAQKDEIEKIVTEHIQKNIPVDTEVKSLAEAQREGATALFDEKYGENVRVVTIKDFSKELCGGTHIKRTGDIACFKIVQESSVASGVRRIEALAGLPAMSYVQEQDRCLKEISYLLKTPAPQLREKVSELIKKQKQLQKELEKSAKTGAAAPDDMDKWLEQKVTVEDIPVLPIILDKLNIGQLRSVYDRIKPRMPEGVIILIGKNGSSYQIFVSVSEKYCEKLHAVDLLKELGRVSSGKGGGKKTTAQGGGKDVSSLEKNLKTLAPIIKTCLTR